MKMVPGFVISMLFAAIAHGVDHPSDWPQFRGPGGSGIAVGQKPPVEFGPEKNVKWKVDVPHGLSSPIVAGEVLVITAFENEELLTIAYDRTNGKESWRAVAPSKTIEKFFKAEGSPAASTPATDGERIVSYFGSCGLVCYDLTGKQLWHYEMSPPYLPGNFGSGVSPIIADGTVVLVRDEAKNGRIVAVDIANGKLKWEKPRQSPVSYCTPVTWDTPAGRQVVAAGHGRMIGYDLASGSEKWFIGGMPSGCCTSPVTADGTLYFAGWSPGGPDDAENQMPTFDAMLKDLDKDSNGDLSRAEADAAFQGFFDSQDTNGDGIITREEFEVVVKFMSDGKNSVFAVKPGGTGDITESHLLWQKFKGLPYIASAIIVGGQYVMVKDGGIVTAYDAKTGDELYMQRAIAEGTYYASPVSANGNIYFFSLEKGEGTVLKAGSAKPEVVAKNPPLGERIAATPAIADDTLYVRTAKFLYAFKAKD